MKVKYMSVDAHLLIPMKKGETQEQAEDRMIAALIKDNISVVGWKEPKIAGFDYERCCELCKHYWHNMGEEPCLSCDGDLSLYDPAEGFDYENE